MLPRLPIVDWFAAPNPRTTKLAIVTLGAIDLEFSRAKKDHAIQYPDREVQGHRPAASHISGAKSDCRMLCKCAAPPGGSKPAGNHIPAYDRSMDPARRYQDVQPGRNLYLQQRNQGHMEDQRQCARNHLGADGAAL